MSRVTKQEKPTATMQAELRAVHSEADLVSSQEIKASAGQQDWQAGFEAMGMDPDTNNVEYALPAAREVLFSG